MQTYQVTIIETLSKTIYVSASSLEEADTAVRQSYSDGKIVLNSDDFQDYEIYSTDASHVSSEEAMPVSSIR